MLGSFLFGYVSFLLYAMMPRVKSFDYTLLTCPSGYVTLTQYSCGLDNVFMPQSECPTGKGCDTSWVCALDVAEDEVKCPSLITCPDDRPIRCPDGLCAETPDGCNNYVSCPPSLPGKFILFLFYFLILLFLIYFYFSSLPYWSLQTEYSRCKKYIFLNLLF